MFTAQKLTVMKDMLKCPCLFVCRLSKPISRVNIGLKPKKLRKKGKLPPFPV